MARKTNDPNVTESSGNAFADLGFANADREQVKAQLLGPSRTAASREPKPERFLAFSSHMSRRS